MADMMQFDLVSPERRLASMQVSSVQIPGADGDLTAMADHAPLITSLRPGVLEVASADGDKRYAVTGGFAEISGTGTSVLAEKAMPLDELTAEDMDLLLVEASAQADAAGGAAKDAADKLVSDLHALKSAAGL